MSTREDKVILTQLRNKYGHRYTFQPRFNQYLMVRIKRGEDVNEPELIQIYKDFCLADSKYREGTYIHCMNVYYNGIFLYQLWYNSALAKLEKGDVEFW